MSDPSAQGEFPGTPIPSPESQVQPNADSSQGIQKRFDQLTAQNYAKDEMIATLQKQQADLLAFQAQNSQPVQQVPQVEVDPELRKMMDAYMRPHLEMLQKSNAQTAAELQAQKFQSLFANVPPQVGQRAQQLMSQWQRAGNTGWVPEDAIRYAAGEAALSGNFKQDGRAAFNQAGSGFTQQGHQPSPAPQASALPNGFDTWPADQQSNYWLEKSGNEPL